MLRISISVLGPSACEVFGRLQSFCGVPELPIEDFPKEWSSFIYDGLLLDEDKVVNDMFKSDFGIKAVTVQRDL